MASQASRQSPARSGDRECRHGAPDLLALSHTSLISREQLKATPGLTLRDRYHPGHDPNTMWTLVREGDIVVQAAASGW